MATGYLLPISTILQFFTDQGVVLAGGKVYTYVAGTTTPVATYTSSALITLQANPIILQSNGRLANPVWVPSGSTVKMVLQDSNGNTISGGTIDNLQGINDIGSALYPITSAETSASITPTSYLYPAGNVLRYGADPTGIVDSTSAINKAITVANTVTIPDGTYAVSASINLKANCVIQGGGLTNIKATASNFSVFLASGTNGSQITQLTVNNITVTGTGQTNVIAFDLTYVTISSVFNNCTSYYCTTGFYLRANCEKVYFNNPCILSTPNGMIFSTSINSVINAPWIDNTSFVNSGGSANTGTGIKFNTNCNQNTVIGGLVQGFVDCIIDSGGNSNAILNVYFEQGSDSHIYINGAYGTFISGTNHYAYNSGTAIKSVSSNNVSVYSPSFYLPNLFTSGSYNVDGTNTSFQLFQNTTEYNYIGTSTGINFTNLWSSSGTYGLPINSLFASGNGVAGNTSAASSAALQLWNTSTGFTNLTNNWSGGGGINFQTGGSNTRLSISYNGVMTFSGTASGTPILTFNTQAATGSATPTFASNKPGSNSATAKWLPVILDGTTYYIPAWT